MNSKFPELGGPLKNKIRAALEQSGHVVQAEGPRNQCDSAARWAERVLNRRSKEFPEVRTRILSLLAQEGSNEMPE